METPWGACQTQGQVATGGPSWGQAHSPASRRGKGQEGGSSWTSELRPRTVFIHTESGYVLSESGYAHIHLDMSL